MVNDKPMQLHIFSTVDQVLEKLADFFIQEVNNTLQRKTVCNVVLSGGNSPKKLYQLLTTTAYRQQVSWEKICFFFGDERYVPFKDENNNGNMAKQTLFDPLQIHPSQVFYIDTNLAPEDSATDYSHRIQQHFGNNQPQFDLILLGLGDNAHTASLFPHTAVLHEKNQLVRAVYIEDIKAFRITMTAPLINQAKKIAFLVYGSAKATAVKNILKGEQNVELYPAQLINNKSETTHWFLDEAAASLIMPGE